MPSFRLSLVPAQPFEHELLHVLAMGARGQDPLQMRRAEDKNMIQAVAPQRSNQPNQNGGGGSIDFGDAKLVRYRLSLIIQNRTRAPEV